MTARQDKLIQTIIVCVIVGNILGLTGTYVFSLATGAMLVLPTVVLYGACMFGANKLVSAVRSVPKINFDDVEITFNNPMKPMRG